MSWSWLWQAIVGNAVYAVLALAAGALVAWLRSFDSRAVPIILSGLGAMALVLVIIILMKVLLGGFGQGSFGMDSAPVKPDDIESTVKRWGEEFGWGSRSVKTDQDRNHFHLVITPIPNSWGVDVLVSKTHP